MRTQEDVILEDDFICMRFKNESDTVHFIERDLTQGVMQFHFVLKGNARFLFNQGTYDLPVAEENGLTLYNPQRSLPIHLEIPAHTWVISVIISIKKFHSLFSTEAEFIPFLNKENIDRKHYTQSAITPSMSVVLYQIMNFNLHSSVKTLYYKAKVYELLSLLFNKPEGNEDESCPFKTDEEETMKIQQAKDILLKNMAEPPTLQQLADEIGLNIKKLKQGFKQVYGDTVYGFLFDYKMEYARKLLDSGNYNVNEVGSKIGYSTASHFIAAFKKKFGTTPKKYLMSLSVDYS
ncbi:MAG TPA: AraC family transcriptional regulator [Flavobacterium sp.]|nr:AraC family transcriptional regulator [Flavobacterium sp.]